MRRAGRRAFRPSVEGSALESRELMAVRPLGPNQTAVRLHPKAAPAWVTGNSGQVGVQVARGGRSANLTTPDGQLYRVDATNEALVRAIPTADGRVDLMVTGSRFDSQLLIKRMAHPSPATTATKFPNGSVYASNVLPVRNIIVKTGAIKSVLGYGTVELSGLLRITNRKAPDQVPQVDRIAIYSMSPGGRIVTTGTVKTLEIQTGVNLNRASDGIFIGQNLNWFNVGNDLILANGAQVRIGRDLGATPEPAKGTGKSGQSATIFGNLDLSNGSSFVVDRNFAFPALVQGDYVRNGVVVVSGPFQFQTDVIAP